MKNVILGWVRAYSIKVFNGGLCVCVRRYSKQTQLHGLGTSLTRTLDSATLCMPPNNTAQIVTRVVLLWKYRF